MAKVFHRCWTGRLWVSIGSLHLGLGPHRVLERVYFGNKRFARAGLFCWVRIPANG